MAVSVLDKLLVMPPEVRRDGGEIAENSVANKTPQPEGRVYRLAASDHFSQSQTQRLLSFLTRQPRVELPVGKNDVGGLTGIHWKLLRDAEGAGDGGIVDRPSG